MTIDELIEVLKKYPGDTEVFQLRRGISRSRVEGDVAYWVEMDPTRWAYTDATAGVPKEPELGDAPGQQRWYVAPAVGELFIGEEI